MQHFVKKKMTAYILGVSVKLSTPESFFFGSREKKPRGEIGFPMWKQYGYSSAIGHLRKPCHAYWYCQL